MEEKKWQCEHQREREADCEFDSAKEIEATISFIPYGKEEKKVDLYPIRGYNSSAFNGARLHREPYYFL